MFLVPLEPSVTPSALFSRRLAKDAKLSEILNKNKLNQNYQRMHENAVCVGPCTTKLFTRLTRFANSVCDEMTCEPASLRVKK